jgi:hypothetical protein
LDGIGVGCGVVVTVVVLPDTVTLVDKLVFGIHTFGAGLGNSVGFSLGRLANVAPMVVALKLALKDVEVVFVMLVGVSVVVDALVIEAFGLAPTAGASAVVSKY